MSINDVFVALPKSKFIAMIGRLNDVAATFDTLLQLDWESNELGGQMVADSAEQLSKVFMLIHSDQTVEVEITEE